MPFRFSLEPVLHLRESLEHQQELRLRAANQRVGRVRHLIEIAEQRGQELRATQGKQLEAGTTAAELRFGLHCAGELQRQHRELEQQLALAQEACRRQREIFQQVQRARETLESVRERQLAAYQKEALRREQRNLDDQFLMRREFLRHG